MNIASKIAALAAVTVMTAAASAQAAVIVSFTSNEAGAPFGQQMVWDFDGVQEEAYSVVFSPGSGLRSVAAGTTPSAAPPPGASGFYAAVRAGGTMTLSTPDIMGLSVFMGSPDSYNSIRFNYADGTSEALNGIALAGGAFGGDQSVGRRMTYSFDKAVSSVVFASGGDSFEFDNIAIVSVVPEPGVWSLMIAGFGLAGAALRRRRTPASCASDRGFARAAWPAHP